MIENHFLITYSGNKLFFKINLMSFQLLFVKCFNRQLKKMKNTLWKLLHYTLVLNTLQNKLRKLFSYLSSQIGFCSWKQFKDYFKTYSQKLFFGEVSLFIWCHPAFWINPLCFFLDGLNVEFQMLPQFHLKLWPCLEWRFFQIQKTFSSFFLFFFFFFSKAQ